MEPTDIFNYAHSRPTGKSNEVSEDSLSFMNMALSQMSWFTGCQYSKISHQTLLFGKEPNIFKSVSALYNFTWNKRTFSAIVSCPYPEFFTQESAVLFEYSVRLYTKHPIDNRTIYATIGDIWNFKPNEYVFRFLLNDFSWFSKNLSTIKENIKSNETSDESDKMILYMQDVIPDDEVEHTGREISNFLLKKIFI